MAAATARAPAADKRWGFAAAAAASPARTPAVGAVGMAPETTILSTQRGSFPWGDRSVLPAPNPWGSSSLLSLKNDGGSGSFGNMNDRPSSRGSSSTSTDGSDLLDSPLPRGRTLQNSSTVMSHPQSTELRSGSFQFPRSQTSFSDALRGPLRNIATRRPTSHGKGFTLSADDFPVLVSKNSQSNSQQGHSFQGRPSFSSVILAAGDEQRKIPITGGNPVSTRNFSMEAQQAPLHATQAPDICMPPPCIDYWHPPPDHPPDRNGIWQEGVASYGPCKPADTPCSFTESFTQNGQSLHKQGEEARHGPVHGGYHPENNDSSYTHVPADACIKSLPHLMVRKVKDNHSDALEKQVIKKDVALLEKIKCLNIKARNLRAGNISEISSCRESKVEQPKSIDVEANVASDVPVSIVFSDITSAFVMANSASESSNHVPTGTSNVSASANIVMIDLSEGHATKSSETIKLGESSDNNVYGVGNTSRNKHGSSAMDTASDIWGPGWQEHSTVDSLPVAMTNTHGSSAIDTASDSWGPGWQEHSAADSLPGAMTKTHGSSAIDTASDSWGPGWQEHSAVDSLPVVMTNTHEDQPFTGNSTQQVHVRTADDMLNSPDYEIQNSKGELSSQHAKQLQEEEWGEIGQKAKSIIKLEDLHNPFVQSQKSNDTPGKSAEYHAYRGWNASRNRHGCSAEEISSSVSGNGWEDHPTVDSSSVVMANTHQDLSFSRNTSWQVHVRNADDLIISSDFEIQHSRRELCAQHAKQLQEEERGKTQQKAKSIAKLEDLNIRPLVQSQKSNDAPGKSADSHEYGGWNASRNKHGVSAEDISSNNFGHGWEDHPAVDSLPVMKNSHPDQSVNWNTYQWVHAETTDVLISPGYEIEHSRCRVSSVHHAKELQEERENIQQKATSVAKLEDLNRRPFVHSQKSYDAPGKSSDYHEFGGWNASRNKHGSSAEDISFNMPGHGWDDHPTVDSFPVMTNTHQDKSFPGKTSQQRSWREFSAQHARQLQKDERVKLQQKAKANAKLVELNRSSFVQDQKSNDLPLEADKFLHKQSSGGSGTTNHDTSASDTCCTSYAENLNVLLIANGTKDTEESVAWSDDSSAQKHFQVEDTEGHVHKQESISRVLTPASDTVDANKGPLIHAIPSAKNTDINMIHIGQKGASESHDSTALIHLQMEEKRREVHSLGKSLRGPPASESAGVKKDSLIHNVMLSAKNNVINMTEHIAQKSVSESHENSAPKHLQVDNRRRQVRSQERVLRERSNIAESTENIMSVAGTLVDTQNAESKPHMGLSIQSKNQRPASPNVFGTVNTSASSVHKTHISGVFINSAIIPVQVSSVRGFTVGSITLGNASLASVNEEEKTVAKEEHDDVTNSCASPKQTKQSGRNQHRVQHVKDPHGSDSIMHTPAEEPSKKEKSDTGGLNCMVVPAPTQPSGNQSIASQNVEPAKTSEIERHAHKPAYKELDLQNPRQMLRAENHTTSSDNSSKSKLDTKSLDKEVLDATTATKSEVKTELENREDEKTSKHIGISMNGSTSAAPELNEQEANSLVLKIMKDLSDQLEQVEKQIESSTHVPTGSRSQPPRMVSLPGFTWGVDQASRSQMQYHVDGQGNMWMNYAASSYVGVNGMARAAAVPTTHLLPGISIPENNRMGGYSPPGWTWDTAECVLISDTADMPPCQGNRPTQNMYGARQMDLMHGTQALGGVAYGATGQELQQLNPVWFPSSQHDGGITM